jgi:membrane protease YdiL (CAAX protease family)
MQNIAEPGGKRYAAAQADVLLASTKHTRTFLTIVLGLTVAGALGVALGWPDDAAPSPAVLPWMYASMIAAQAMWVRFIQNGMRRHGRSVREFLERDWARPVRLLTDLVYAGAATALILMISSGVATVLHWPRPELSGFLPQGTVGYAMWLCVAVTAGICEEIVFRGYFQRQLAALTGKPWLAVFGQAVVFGVVHSYQGLSATAVIALAGLVLGLLAKWRGSIVACVIAHAALDILAGVQGY